MNEKDKPPKIDKRKSLPHLFQPGQSGNPGGKPKGAISKERMVQEAILDVFELKEGENPKDSYLYKFLDVFKKSSLDPSSLAHKVMAERLLKSDVIQDLDRSMNQTLSRDIDFQRYRIRKLAFDKQQTVLDSHARSIDLMCGRRGGKSSAVELKAMDISQSKLGARVLLIGLTITKCMDIYLEEIKKKCAELGYSFRWDNEFQQLHFSNDSLIQFGGNANKAEREKYLGKYWDMIAVDEAQSQPNLQFFVETILQPMLIDTNGILMLIGTGPRTPGTFWEKHYNDNRPAHLRMNWNLSANPYIPNYAEALANIRDKYQLLETDTLYLREYLGLIAYDTEALVFRMNEDNYFTWDQFAEWVKEQSPADIRFTAGLDFGYTDANAFSIVCYARYSNIKFQVYEHKAFGEDITDLINAIKQGIDFVQNDERFKTIYVKDFLIQADSARPELIAEFNNRHALPVVPAIKTDAMGSVDNFRTEVKRGWFKCLADSAISDEATRTIYRRSDVEGLPTFITKEIDDDIYHPDMLDATRYGMGPYWIDYPLNKDMDDPAKRPLGAPEPWKPILQQDGPFARRF